MQLVPRQVRICEEVGLMPQHPELREKKRIFIRELFNSLAQRRADSCPELVLVRSKIGLLDLLASLKRASILRE
jgi:hypothetical protein